MTISRDEIHRRQGEIQLAANALQRAVRELTQAIHFHNESQPEPEMDTEPPRVRDCSSWFPPAEQGPPY